eukprot:scaffold26699_cov33-Phaeocystis_antarctica.AAC.1
MHVEIAPKVVSSNPVRRAPGALLGRLNTGQGKRRDTRRRGYAWAAVPRWYERWLHAMNVRGPRSPSGRR